MISNHTTGIWEQPQIIPFQDLMTKYHFNACLEATEIEQVKSVIKDLDFSKHFNSENIDYFNETIKRPIDYFSDEWEKKRTIRNVVLSNEKIPNWLIKVYSVQPGRGNPLASILRVPMAHLVQQVITEYALDSLVVPKKGLIPLFESDKIENLNENQVNEAFLVVAQKFSLLSREETLQKISELSEDQQQNLAKQLCMIPLKTGLGDYTWNNIKMTTEDQIGIVDTEPLYGELFVDQYGKGYKRSNQLIKLYTLEKCAKQGLKIFGESSSGSHLSIFHDMSQKFLEELD